VNEPFRFVTALTAVYDADGGVRGEVSYVWGKLTRRAHCSLCDITHSPWHRKREWDTFVHSVGVPVAVVHRNEQASEVAAASVPLPSVVAHTADGRVVRLLGPPELDLLAGSVSRFAASLQHALDVRQLTLSSTASQR